jgi:polyhydroxyalkanoate synthase
MNTTHPFFDNNAWQAWLMQQTNAAPMAATMKELGVGLDPAVMAKLQSDYMQEMTTLWQDMLASKAPEVNDRRFAAPEWKSNPMHAFSAATYLLNARFLTAMVDATKTDAKTKNKIRFAVQQLIDAASPANFLVTNPEAQHKIIETNGESLAHGIANMLDDMRKGHISQSDESAFEVGKNVATTEGAVVFENDFFQLLQYKPLTKTVFETPLLIVPPCINKYYILDLQPDNSLVRYAVEQGHTVFLVSWRNPDESMSHATWDDYIERGAMKAISVVREMNGQKQINALGFCVGGTILATAAAVLYARKQKPFASMTLLTTFLDFSDAGVIEVFIDEAQIAMREQTIGKGGLMPGHEFTAAFSSLRPNDLVWNYVKSNYLKGEAPRPFDMLYWNADATNLPGPMFCWYLRNLYLENRLIKPGKLTVLGEKIDLSKIDTPTFIYGSREDHIVPWGAAYESTKLLNPKKRSHNRFVLGASGHIAGVINPAAKKKRSYWTNDELPATPDEWLEGATEQPGSWWVEWADFLSEYAGRKVKARTTLGSAEYPVIEPAPGRYVKVKAG